LDDGDARLNGCLASSNDSSFWQNPVAAGANHSLVFYVGVSHDVSDAQEEQMAKKAKKKAKKM
jgi:hypothetical protein